MVFPCLQASDDTEHDRPVTESENFASPFAFVGRRQTRYGKTVAYNLHMRDRLSPPDYRSVFLSKRNNCRRTSPEELSKQAFYPDDRIRAMLRVNEERNSGENGRQPPHVLSGPLVSVHDLRLTFRDHARKPPQMASVESRILRSKVNVAAESGNLAGLQVRQIDGRYLGIGAAYSQARYELPYALPLRSIVKKELERSFRDDGDIEK
jgi:hypothetical protein